MIKNVLVLFSNYCIENQRIFLVTRKDLGVGGWGLENPYSVRILNLLEIIGRSLRGILLNIITLNGIIPCRGRGVKLSTPLNFCLEQN